MIKTTTPAIRLGIVTIVLLLVGAAINIAMGLAFRSNIPFGWSILTDIGYLFIVFAGITGMSTVVFIQRYISQS